jgi:hypothetical protein
MYSPQEIFFRYLSEKKEKIRIVLSAEGLQSEGTLTEKHIVDVARQVEVAGKEWTPPDVVMQTYRRCT